MSYLILGLGLIFLAIAVAGDYLFWNLPSFALLRQNANRLEALGVSGFRAVAPSPSQFRNVMHLRLSEFLHMPQAGNIYLTLREGAEILVVKEEIIAKAIGEIRLNATIVLLGALIGFLFVIGLDPSTREVFAAKPPLDAFLGVLDRMMSYHVVLIAEVVFIFAGFVSILRSVSLVRSINHTASQKLP